MQAIVGQREQAVLDVLLVELRKFEHRGQVLETGFEQFRRGLVLRLVTAFKQEPHRALAPADAAGDFAAQR